MKLGYIGLGKMGLNQALRLHEKGHEVLVWNRSEGPRKEAEARGIRSFAALDDLVKSLEAPRTLWIMVPNNAVDEVISQLLPLMSEGDTLIDGGNTYYKDTTRRAEDLRTKGLKFLDAGVSGGPHGARDGACIMIGGEKEDYDRLEPLWRDLSVEKGYAYMGGHGAGHFVKMVHNGIEYGMMQAIAEGFEIMKKSPFSLNLTKVADVYQHGSVVESRLIGWLEQGFKEYGEDLAEITPAVAHTGEGEWTVKAGEEFGVETPVIKASFDFRVHSAEKPSFAGKVLSTLRNMFGGHQAK
ncbi:MAG TPA: decarboxylating 6-phosphogluconate dehydrogenase [Candidatus Paceibacterota bacterium]|nr:decarboxylating 6-phosphogluconate dehydrogenase [Candidatus Paceibacterota bacterium]